MRVSRRTEPGLGVPVQLDSIQEKDSGVCPLCYSLALVSYREDIRPLRTHVCFVHILPDED